MLHDEPDRAPLLSTVQPDSGELLRAGPVVHRVLEAGGGTKGRLGVLECRMPPGWSGPPQHIHRAHDETFFVLSGRVRFTSGADAEILERGGFVTAGAGVPHTFGNADADAPASLIVTVTPDLYVGYFRELENLRPGADGMLDPGEILDLMSRYATEPYRV